LNSGQCPLFFCAAFFLRLLTLNTLRPISPRHLGVLLVMCAAVPLCWSQLAPSGYTGGLNTPTAHTLPEGSAEWTLTNSVPEKARFFPGQGGFGGYNLGFGLLPGLELVGRLSFDGDLQCNLYEAGCKSWTRDLSMGGKWQLPLKLPLNSRLALGVTDVGGAATNFRQSYAVITSQPAHGLWEISLGRARGTSPYSLMDGSFGSVSAKLHPHVQAVLEHDSRETRAGLKGQWPLHPRLSLVWAGSRKFTRASAQQSEQLTLGLQFALERPANREALEREAAQLSVYRTQPLPMVEQAHQTFQPLQLKWAAHPFASSAAAMPRADSAAFAPAFTKDLAQDPRQPEGVAERLVQSLQRAGFADISVGLDHTGDAAQARHWLVQAEPLSWRKSRHEALGKVFRLWLDQEPQPQERITVVLSYLRQSTVAVRSSAQCLADFKAGYRSCESGPVLELIAAPEQELAAQTNWLQQGKHSSWLKPRVALAPSLNYSVGTEYGLADYALALDTGWEVPLARGLMWQGVHATPLQNSADFGPGQVFDGSRKRPGVQTSMLSYVAQPIHSLWVQASAGYLNPDDRGSQLDVRWSPGDGQLSLSATAARYQRELVGATVQPQLVQARWSVLPGRWAVELNAGRFFMQDEGFRISSMHWFDDYRLSVYYRQSQSPKGVRMPLTKFAGFSLSIPLGGSESAQLGPLNLRFREQWSLGLETKVGAKDNSITGGYGTIPALRHGLNDVSDFDRSGLADFWEQRHRIRSAMN
jgi:hypothetical protein